MAAAIAQTACAAPLAAEESGARGRTQMVRELEACFDAQHRRAPFSGVVLMEREGESFVRISGFADEEGKVPIRRDTRFRLASVTKVITRAAIARLIEEGKLAFDTPVGAHVRGLPPKMAAVTVEQLLNHRSGVAPLETFEDGPDLTRLLTARRATDLLPLLVKHELQFEPGTRTKYSNGGFMLLGILIEALTGRTYGEHVEESVYRPLGMTSSSLVADARMAMPLTTEDMPDASRPRTYPHWNRVGVPSGNSVSTADDLMKLGRALVAGSFLSPGVQARAFPEDTPIKGIFQSGGSAGVDTAFILSSATGWRLVLLSNHDAPAGELMARALVGVAGIYGPQGCDPPELGKD